MKHIPLSNRLKKGDIVLTGLAIAGWASCLVLFAG